MSALTITPARYAKGRFVVQVPPSGHEFKGPLHYLVERMGGRWVRRDCGYQVSARQAKRIARAERLFMRGGDK